ncbi:hypothetical protein K439DRAFT_1665143, partial [Ramaria rubella]
MNTHDFEDDPLQAALATAFADSPLVAPGPSASTSASSSAQSNAPEAALEAEMEGSGDDAWKEGYEQMLTSWRAESAVARDKAEKERERWRVIREQEAEREKRAGPEHKEPEWETVVESSTTEVFRADATRTIPEGTGRRPSASQEAARVVHLNPRRRSSPSPADGRDLVAGETSRLGADPIESLLPHIESTQSTSRRASYVATAPQSNTDDHGLSSSRTWEEVPSIESSFPSLSFPDRSPPGSLEPRERPTYQRPPAPPSVTLAIFDSSLSPRARALALVSSLAINLLLPFVNGVMLGFGEIFAKNIVGFFGWKIPGTAVGIRAAPRRK